MALAESIRHVGLRLPEQRAIVGIFGPLMRALLFLTVSLLASCATGLRPRQSDLVGQWRYADKTQSCGYIFSPDGTFRAEVAIGGKTISKFTGRWSVKGDALLYEYLTDQRGEIATGSKDRDKLLEVTKDHFLIEAGDGSHRRYVRLGPLREST